MYTLLIKFFTVLYLCGYDMDETDTFSYSLFLPILSPWYTILIILIKLKVDLGWTFQRLSKLQGLFLNTHFDSLLFIAHTIQFNWFALNHLLSNCLVASGIYISKWILEIERILMWSLCFIKNVFLFIHKN